MRAWLLVAGGELVVQQAIVTATALRGKRVRRPLRLWVRQTTQNMARAAACAAGAAAGAAAVALVLPANHPRLAQWATLAGLVAGDIAGAALVTTATEEWVAEAKRAE
jgi:hypothetical protein